MLEHVVPVQGRERRRQVERANQENSRCDDDSADPECALDFHSGYSDRILMLTNSLSAGAVSDKAALLSHGKPQNRV